MIAPTPAQYRTATLPKYVGNPLIEALPAPLALPELQKRITVMPEIPADLHRLGRLERKMLAEDLAYAYLTPQQVVQLYEEVYITLHEGYVARNPLNPAFTRELYRIRDPFGAPFPGSKNASTSLLFIGPTRFGKSAIVRSVFSLFPPVIAHESYNGKQLHLKQLVYLKIDCPSNGSSGAFIKNLWRAFDIALGTNYFEQYANSRMKIPDLQKCIALACATYAVGFLVVDEVHYLRPVLEDQDRERATLPFVDELLNGLGIPVLLVGTWKSARLLNRSATTAVRVCSGLTLTEKPYALSDPYWRLLVSRLWKYQYCLKPITITDSVHKVIHHCTGGLPGLLVKLLITAQKYAIDTGLETVDEAALMQVYRTTFILLHDALAALHHGEFERYEDLLPRKRLDES